MVIFRSLSDGSVLLAMTPGTVQPKPINIGTILRPDSPILRRSLSMTKATRAIYPLSSNNGQEEKQSYDDRQERKHASYPLKNAINDQRMYNRINSIDCQGIIRDLQSIR